MGHQHHYRATVTWTGNQGEGTANYRSYSRSHDIEIEGKPTLAGSSDPAFMGDAAAHNPEDMLVAAVSACHMLWYLHLCSDAKIKVLAYRDSAEGTMEQGADGGGRFTRLVVRPEVTIAAGGDSALAERLHEEANRRCFIANSLSLPVGHEATIHLADAEG